MWLVVQREHEHETRGRASRSMWHPADAAGHRWRSGAQAGRRTCSRSSDGRCVETKKASRESVAQETDATRRGVGDLLHHRCVAVVDVVLEVGDRVGVISVLCPGLKPRAQSTRLFS